VIPRYTHPDMGRIWSDERRYRTWLEVEVAAAEAMAEAGLVPREAALDIRDRGDFDIAASRTSNGRRSTTSSRSPPRLPRRVGPSARWLHFGMTSSDVIDTAQALQMREACDVILGDLDALAVVVRERAFEHRRTPMIGRTHGVHAEPMTFGLKLALWSSEIERDIARVRRARTTVAVGKLSGAVGTFAHLSPDIEAATCRRLGLVPAAVASQVIQRDRHAELMTTLAITAASLEKFALEIRGLQKTEIGEVEEPFAKGQKGSSAMPHKRNPIGCEQIVGLARLLRGNAHAALENIALWHERDISHSSVERVVLPDSFIALDHMLRRLTRIVKGLVVYPDRMRENLNRSAASCFRTVLLGLPEASHGRRRPRVGSAQRHALVRRDGISACCSPIPMSLAVLTRAEVERSFDLDEQFRHVDEIFARVYERTTANAEIGGGNRNRARLNRRRSGSHGRMSATRTRNAA
jgi:adenylosuccinate lyase